MNHLDPDDLPPPEDDGSYEQPPGPLKFHYGDGTIIDAGTMIHDDCGGIISIIDNGLVCECGANADLPPESMPSEGEIRIGDLELLSPDEQAAISIVGGMPHVTVDTLETISISEPSVLAPTCIERHVTNCECRGAARGPCP